MTMRIDNDCNQVARINYFEEPEPHTYLGPHKESSGETVVRANLPDAKRAWITLNEREIIPMQRLYGSSVFEAWLNTNGNSPKYKIGRSINPRDLELLILHKKYELFQQYKGRVDDERLNKLVSDELLKLVDEKQIQLTDDPYSFNPDITNDDIWLWNEGTNYRSHERFGARIKTIDGVEGVHFTVWAPNAQAISVVGDFNDWQPGIHQLSQINSSGVWGLFIPGLGEGALYKFAIKHNGEILNFKSDPFALASQFPTKYEPERTASIVSNLDGYQWNDTEWMQRRSRLNSVEQPMSIYEVHLGSWKRKNQRYNNEGFLNYRELAHEIVDYAKNMGYTHVQLMPVMEHPYYPSWGYQCTGFFSPTGRHGSPQDLMYFIDYSHKNNIGVLLDWVPGHFAKNMDALNMFDGTQLFAYEDPRLGEHKSWGTLVPNYGKGAVKSFLISSAMFWLEKYHVDGLRVDAVASMLYRDYDRQGEKGVTWLPNRHGGNEHLEAVDFLRQLNAVVHEQYPGVLTIAEDSSSWQGITKPQNHSWQSLGFDIKWNMGWMNNTLSHFRRDPIHRGSGIESELVHSSTYAFTENFLLPLSHDEVAHGKGPLMDKVPGDEWQKLANLRLLYGYMFTYPGKKLLFMGNDFAQRKEWNENRELDWWLPESCTPHRQVQDLVRDLNKLYLGRKELHELDHSGKGFQWIELNQRESVIAFARIAKEQKNFSLVVCNLTPIPRENYELSVPQGIYKEILNTDAPKYGGAGNHKNPESLTTSPISRQKWYRDLWTNYQTSIKATIPPLGVSIFEYQA